MTKIAKMKQMSQKRHFPKYRHSAIAIAFLQKYKQDMIQIHLAKFGLLSTHLGKKGVTRVAW